MQFGISGLIKVLINCSPLVFVVSSGGEGVDVVGVLGEAAGQGDVGSTAACIAGKDTHGLLTRRVKS